MARKAVSPAEKVGCYQAQKLFASLIAHLLVPITGICHETPPIGTSALNGERRGKIHQPVISL